MSLVSLARVNVIAANFCWYVLLSKWNDCSFEWLIDVSFSKLQTIFKFSLMKYNLFYLMAKYNFNAWWECAENTSITNFWNEGSRLGLRDRLPYHLLLNLLNSLEVLQPHHLCFQIFFKIENKSNTTKLHSSRQSECYSRREYQETFLQVWTNLFNCDQLVPQELQKCNYWRATAIL